jgi:hypothetical protein
MTKELKQIIITGVLIVVLIFVMMSNLKKTTKKPVAQPVAVEAAPAFPVASPNKPVLPAGDGVLNVQNERAKLPWGRDPFVIMLDEEFGIDQIRLQGISFGKDKSGYANINGEIVTQGDTIAGYEVGPIEKDKVLLKKDGQSFYLTFSEP